MKNFGPTDPKARHFQILSLSGGGYFGLYSAAILAELEGMLGDKPLNSCFDLIAGTSVGGILALGIAAGIPARTMLNAFIENGERIFSDRAAPTGRLSAAIDALRSLFGPKYATTALRETVASILGDKKIGDLERPCIIPTVNLTKGGPQILKTPHHSSFTRDYKLSAVDVAIATSAAPTFFPIAHIGHELFADGGLFANSPDHIALHEAEYFFQIPSQCIRMLSVGTTTSKFSFSHSAGVNLGVLGWISGQRLVQAMLASQQQLVEYMVRHRLAHNYLRLDAVQSPDQTRDLALDIAHIHARTTILGLAEGTIRRFINDNTLKKMLENVAPPSVFSERKLAGSI